MENPEEKSPAKQQPDGQKSSMISRDDLRTLERLMSIYRPLLTNTASQFIPEAMQGRIDRSDLVQETLVRGLSQRDQFRGKSEAEFVAWLKQILKNVALDWIRHHTAQKRDISRETEFVNSLVSQGNSPSQNIHQQEEFGRIASALSQLTTEQKTAVELRSEGLTFSEIGKRMGRSEDAARMLWGRGLAHLIELLRHDVRPE